LVRLWQKQTKVIKSIDPKVDNQIMKKPKGFYNLCRFREKSNLSALLNNWWGSIKSIVMKFYQT
jgi:hypothetical protein